MKEEYDMADEGTQRCPKGYFMDGDEYVCIYAATQEDVDIIISLIEGVENRFEPHEMIQKIINEEADGYFSGQVNLESTVKKIQNRITLFLQESVFENE